MFCNFDGISIDIFGASHDEYVGGKIFGIEKGFNIDTCALNAFLERRKGVEGLCTKRAEKDEIEFISGVDKNGQVTGIIDLRIKNTDVKKEDYEKIKTVIRPSTADYPSFVKYGEIFSGSGQFSGRMTAPFTALGGIAVQVLKKYGVKIYSHILSVGELKDRNFKESDFDGNTKDLFLNKTAGDKALKFVEKVKEQGNSVGGVIECAVTGVPIGVGGALGGGLESAISKAVFAIPAVKGIEFGSGFNGSKKLGSQNNDELFTENGNIKYKSNNDGGIVGGMANGNVILFRVAFKPVPSISIEQNTVDVKENKNCKIKIQGRHDTCIPLRALPIVESAAALSVLGKLNAGNSLSNLRAKIDAYDSVIANTIEERERAVKLIGEEKAKSKIKTTDKSREKEIKENLKENFPKAKEYIDGVYKEIFKASKKSQKDKK